MCSTPLGSADEFEESIPPDTSPTRDMFRSLESLVADCEHGSLSTEQGLTDVVSTAVTLIPEVQYAAITLASRTKGISTPATTHRYPVMVDEIQGRHQEGPCLSAAAWQHHVLRIADLSFDPRWPKYREDVLTHTPIRSILSFELATSFTGVSALTFYADRAHAFGQESVELGLTFASHTALAWTMLRHEDHVRSALASRDIIGQAKGMLMERFSIDAMQAFSILTRLSQQTNVKLADIAQRLVSAEDPFSHDDRPDGTMPRR